MALELYKDKRQFDQTPEPAGGRPAGKALRFVVQKHQASRLHYDFRLELGGVLKSWAVPKGPSLNPDDKRLAMMVEDHPYDYKDFEGIIPEGNYGAGSVMVWDEGTYHGRSHSDKKGTEHEFHAGLAAGHFTFILQGKKLKGEFALVKIKDAKENNAWLLVKKGDEFASNKDVTKADRSAKTEKTMTEIAGSTKKWLGKLSIPKITDAPKGPMPHHIKPMLATLVDEPFNGDDWQFEVKWDGYRAVAELDKKSVELYSRNLQPFNDKFKPVADELEALKIQAIFDGEVVVVDSSGRPDFQLLQNYLKGAGGHLVYYIFDLIYLDGRDLSALPLKRRQEILKQLLPDNLDHLKVSDHIDGRGVDFFRAGQAKNLEGIMAKRVNSTYEFGRRGRDWLKIKTHQRQEAVIGGYTEPRGSRKHFGALVLGVYDGKDLVYIGHTGGGFDEHNLAELYPKLKRLERKSSPFSTKFKTNAPVHWVKPELVCEVTFAEWTDEGQMRQPIFIDLRIDKQPEQVKKETAKAEAAFHEARPGQADEVLNIAGREVKITHRSKIYWPKDGYSKGDVIDYYQKIAPFMLPYLKDRPESLHRHPSGIEGDSFFQKNMGDAAPSWVKTKLVHSEGEERDLNYLVCQDEATLVYMANLGCIEINPWLSRLKNLDQPDYCVIDLDPEDIDFKAVVETAQATHELLNEIGIASYCKTSGATGLHIFTPLAAKYSYDQSKQFAEIIAHLVSARLPKITSIVRNPAQRQQRVYVDFLQNRKGQTLASAYSLRPRVGAPVSTPLKWSEVNNKLDPADFNLETIHGRLKKVGDLWQPVLEKGIDLEKALAKLSAIG